MEYFWDWVSSLWSRAPALDEDIILPPGELESIDGKGVITRLGPEYGLVDGKFSMDLSEIGMTSLQVGDRVNYCASRPAPNREWVINSVSSVENRKVRTGVVLVDRRAKINDEHLSIISHSRLNKFRVDDLISVQIGFENEVISIEPLRTRKQRIGVITAYNQEFKKGKIDDEVFFSGELSQIKGCSLLQVGDYVEYDAIERKGLLPWRATCLSITLPPSHKLIKKPIGPNLSHTKELMQAKKGVSFSGKTLDFGNVHFEQSSSRSIDIQNNGSKDIYVNKVTFTGRSAQFSTDLVTPQKLSKAALLSLNINCSALNIGKMKVLVIVELSDESNEVFSIGAHLLSNVLPPSQSPKESLKKCQLKSFKQFSVIPGRRLIRSNQDFNKSWFFKLKSYPIPEALKMDPKKIKGYLKKGSSVTTNDFLMKFRTLLFIEEIQDFENMEKTILSGLRMHQVGDYLEMNIGEDLALFPSLFEGDEVKVQPENDDYEYQGFIHCIKGSIVYLQFDPSFHKSYSGDHCSVKFIKSRTPYRIMHRSVEIAEQYLGPEVLFPSEIRLKKPIIYLKEEVKVFKREPTPVLQKMSKIYPARISVADKLNRSFNAKKSVAQKEHFLAPKYSFDLQTSFGPKASLSSTKNLPHHFSYNSKPPPQKGGQKIIPPYLPPTTPKKQRCSIEWTQPYLNREQKLAVRSILKGEARPLPYIIFGPPGTGKTVTLLETILQTFRLRNDSRILVAAPSNASCDLLVKLLAESNRVKPGEVVRILGARRKFENIPENLSPYYFSIKNEKETVEGLLKSRIVVTTCTSSSFFSRIKDFRRFTHVFIDEAGFVLEPDILTPLNFVDVDDGQIVLAGDAKQLSPVLTSSLAKEYGLAYSLIERLCSFNPLYAPNPNKFVTRFSDSYDSLLITKLVRNYRNHPSILKLPSKLFYHDELIPSVASNQSFKGYDILTNDDFPIVFHALEGEQLRDEDSPSWYNRQEAFQIVLYLRKIYLVPDVSSEHIGIITPYRKQVDCIRNYIQSFDLPMPKVGSVEEFQGQERPIILLSTVRSSLINENESSRHVLGFVGDEKRFNVALTRAKDLLICVGNPFVLVKDPVWKEFIAYCDENHATGGFEFNFR